MPRLLRRMIPTRLINIYHRCLALIATLWYGRPSRHLVVIGVTGTDGKTTTASLITDILRLSGRRVGLSSSAYFFIDGKYWPNTQHITMPGRFALQRLLRRMVQAGCQYAIIEVSSEGLVQNRHLGIDFDIAVITNLSPEHLKTHGTFENYRQAKGILFGQIIKGGDKTGPDGRPVKKTTIVNLDDPSADYFLKFWAEQHYGVALKDYQPQTSEKMTVLQAENIKLGSAGSQFMVNGEDYELPLPGDYNILNALEALAVAQSLDVDPTLTREAIAHANPVPGRWQEIPTGRGWRVVVDFALTPNALKLFYQALKQTGASRIIAVFGAAGGGRDAWKRPELGVIAGEQAAAIILTTDDPYDEDPERIAGEIFTGIPPDRRGITEIILDRYQAIARAMELAQPGDVIAVTGMGSATTMMVKGKQIPWNDAEAVQKLLS